MSDTYTLDLRRVGHRWWATLSRDRHIVAGNMTLTRAGARRWARREAAKGQRYSTRPDVREAVAA